MNPIPLASRVAIFVATLMPLLTFRAYGQSSDSGAKPPGVGDQAPEFALPTLDGERVRLSDLREDGPVVVIVLRGYPGYQCPICSRQIASFIGAADKLRDAGASVAMIYPGPAEDLDARAKEFLGGKTMPDGFHFLVDPGYEFTREYRLRWDAPRETAYPSTFAIRKEGQIAYAKVSRTHGNRASVEDVLDGLRQLRAENERGSEANADDAAAILERVRRHQFHPVDGGFTKDARLDHHGIADLNNRDWRVRTLAVRDLTRIGASAVGALLEGLSSDDLHVRHVSALALGIFPTEEAFAGTLPARREALRRRLEGDSSPIVRSEAAIALGRVGGNDAASALRTARDHDASRDVRHQCELALDRLEKKTDDGEVFDAYRSMDESRFGQVAVGEPAADFTLRDTDGRAWKLADHLGKKPVVLVWIFADWCPVCHGEFRDLIGMKDEFLESDVEIVTIECHDRYRARVMAGQELDPSYWFSKKSPQETYRKGLDWPHLSDPAGAVGAVYGVQPLAFAVHSEYINRPSTIIIDEDGIVRFAYYGTYWGDRPSIEQTLEMVREGKYEFEHPRRLASGEAN